jgi:Protein of unknown function (DUF1573)
MAALAGNEPPTNPALDRSPVATRGPAASASVLSRGRKDAKRRLALTGICLLASAIAFLAGRKLPPPEYFVAAVSTPSGLTVLGDRDVVADRTDRTTPLEHVFELHNPTSRPIHVKEVRCGCACMASHLEAQEFPPGTTLRLTVTVRTFDAYRSKYREAIVVKTDAGELELWICGRLPLPDRVIFRPVVFHLEPVPDSSVVVRTAFFRVPKQCCRDLAAEQVEWNGSRQASIGLAEQAPTELYREFTLTFSVPDGLAHSVTGKLSLETGCRAVQIEVNPLPRKF